MRKDKIDLVLGILVLILPMTGLTRDLKNILIYICGVLIVIFALISIYLRSKYNKPRIKSDIFVESKPEEISENTESNS